MQDSELLVQYLHLFAMWASIIALLAIPSLLMFPQAHDLCSFGANVNQVHQRCYKHCCVEPRAQPIGGGRCNWRGGEVWQDGGCAARVGKKHYDGCDGLKREIYWERVLL